MSSNSLATGFLIRGLRVRSMVYLKVSAVTGSFDGSEKRNPGRIVNV